jgi:hypothetical protein
MPKTRRFKTYSEGQQMSMLLHCLSLASTDFLPQNKNPRLRTDLIGVACQYGSHYGVRREDFEAIKDLTVQELIQKLQDNGV